MCSSSRWPARPADHRPAPRVVSRVLPDGPEHFDTYLAKGTDLMIPGPAYTAQDFASVQAPTLILAADRGGIVIGMPWNYPGRCRTGGWRSCPAPLSAGRITRGGQSAGALVSGGRPADRLGPVIAGL